jgi:hypothetical protein
MQAQHNVGSRLFSSTIWLGLVALALVTGTGISPVAPAGVALSQTASAVQDEVALAGIDAHPTVALRRSHVRPSSVVAAVPARRGVFSLHTHTLAVQHALALERLTHAPTLGQTRASEAVDVLQAPQRRRPRAFTPPRPAGLSPSSRSATYVFAPHPDHGPMLHPRDGTVLTVTDNTLEMDGDTSSVAALLANPGPDGTISLAEALAAVNHDALSNGISGYTIRFALPLGANVIDLTGSDQTLFLQAPNTTIDGAGVTGKPGVLLIADGANALVGLDVTSGGNTIRNLATYELALDGPQANDNQVLNNYLGTDITGLAAGPSAGNGIEVRFGASNNLLQGNVAAGNSFLSSAGIFIEEGASHNTVRGNTIGLNVAGQPLPNTQGLVIGTGIGQAPVVNDGNMIGGTRTGGSCVDPCNLISGNAGPGLTIGEAAGDATNTTVAGNAIGVDPTGTHAVPNGSTGVLVQSGSVTTTIGGPRATPSSCDGACNLISGNGTGGISIDNASATTVQGNNLGVDITGTHVITNGQTGKFADIAIVDGATATTIGGLRSSSACSGVCNLLDGSAGPGIYISDPGTMSTTVQGNFVGTDATGAYALPNGEDGVDVYGGPTFTTIGGARPASSTVCDGVCNLISGNGNSGLSLSTVATMSTTVQGNFVGVNATGVYSIANGFDGLTLRGAMSTMIGGARPASSTVCDGVCNLISGNGNNGVAVTTAGTQSTTVQGNFVGTDATGTHAVANGWSGLAVSGGISTTIGGARPASSTVCDGVCNLISGNAQNGVYLTGAGTTANTVTGNSVGTDVTGAHALPNGWSGIALFYGATANIIGGRRASNSTACDGPCNLVSGNGNYGISVANTGTMSNTVQGNFVGTDATGTHAIANSWSGLALSGGAAANTIGGRRASNSTVCDGPCNLVSGNGNYGATLFDAGTTGNTVQGNVIGTNATGAHAIPNNWSGVAVQNGAVANMIGAAQEAQSGCTGGCNLVSGNTQNGILLTDGGTKSNTVQGNFVGVSISGTTPIGNGLSGIALFNATADNTIGGNRTGTACAAPCNLISGNGHNGIYLSDSGTISNTVAGNYIGMDIAASKAIANQGPGIGLFNGTSNNLIGGARTAAQCAGPCNLVGGNTGDGITVSDPGSANNKLQGNAIGVYPAGVLTTALPNGGNGVTIQNGATTTTVGGSRVVGSLACDGPCNLIGGNTAAGVVISGTGTSNSVIAGNFIGVDSSGQSAIGNMAGVSVTAGATGNTIGGSRPAAGCDSACNLVSGNGGPGVALSGAGTASNTVAGNYIGTNIAGSSAIPNVRDGVDVLNGASTNVIGSATGGTSPAQCSGPCNLIAGNGANGVTLAGTGTATNTVGANDIGLTISGTALLANSGHGVAITGTASQNTIGGARSSATSTACDGACNLISGNGLDGVFLGPVATNNTVAANYIGVGSTGQVVVANVIGVEVDDAMRNTIGGTRSSSACVGPCNLIGGNLLYGVEVRSAAAQNTVAGNYIGVNVTGLAALGNGDGIYVALTASKNMLGGARSTTACAGLCNLISGNHGDGINLNAGATQNTVAGNDIGVTSTGAALRNTGNGITIRTRATKNTIGGTRVTSAGTACADVCNLISGNAGYGLELTGTGTVSNTVVGNFIGPALTGMAAVPNAAGGVLINATSQNMIGGARLSTSCAGLCNLISGNRGSGVTLNGAGTTSNSVQGNFIGTAVTGASGLANTSDGITIMGGAAKNTIGGVRTTTATTACSGLCNLIGGNLGNGVTISGTGTLSNTVQGNYIGANSAGSGALSNAHAGVAILGGANGTLIGGMRTASACSGSCNLISGNLTSGVFLSGSNTSANTVAANDIGVTIDGVSALPNGTSGSRLGGGVLITAGAVHNVVGGASSPEACTTACNIIGHNIGNGVTIGSSPSDSTTRGNTISGNSIYADGALGIDLGNDGVTPNGQTGPGAGPNDLVHVPTKVVADYNGIITMVSGVLSATLPQTYRVDVYADQAPNPTGYGEGQLYLGSVTPGSTGTFSLQVSGKLPYPYVSATATDANGSTSEFSHVCGGPDGPCTLQALTLAPSSVTAGQRVTATLTLVRAAPAGGLVIPVASSAPAVAQVPANVNILPQATSGTFPVTTATAATTTTVTISATYGPDGVAANLVVVPHP